MIKKIDRDKLKNKVIKVIRKNENKKFNKYEGQVIN